ncbi:hypothetical protein HER10_EVM0008417 [Colletotrichum scovillei]|uniref:uncharacterized protein n=1 Tax=Colletotrichum scovillei TaxID=1209932 RepID=UPI0015C3ABCB|nr:uncharacterized protein HER10_EVM0008417 [Colletotrichum scovillei]KAF4776733.1 hypothetical protein HER10_EVM0008417 [Colletotrichum scovillei]
MSLSASVAADSLPFLQYAPLNCERSVRIVILSPSIELDDPIQCDLREVRLGSSSQETTPYEALSYVWGGRRGEHPIRCNGCRVDVTKNCLEALRHLRYSDRERVLWIDAICIDQSSIPEKNVQVALMGDVYRFAARTIVWIGTDESPGNLLLSLFRRFIPLTHNLAEPTVKTAHAVLAPGAETYTNAVPSRNVLKAIELLTKVPWFTRTWTLQELCLSEHVVITLGKSSLSWESLNACLKHWTTLAGRKFGHRTSEFDLVNLADSFGMKMNYRSALLGEKHENSNIPKLASAYLATRLIKTIRRRNAMDKRDQSFSLHNLLGRLGISVPNPDYTKPVTRVYEDLALALCLHSGSFWVLHMGSSEDKVDGLPSWVPDFSQFSPGGFKDQWDLLSNPPPIIAEEVSAIGLLQSGRNTGQLLIRARRLPPVTMISGSHVPNARYLSTTVNYGEDIKDLVLPAVAKWFLFAESLEFFPSRRRGAEALLALIASLATKKTSDDEFKPKADITQTWWANFYRGLMMGFTVEGQRSTKKLVKSASRRGRCVSAHGGCQRPNAQSIGWSMMNENMTDIDTTSSVLLACQGLSLCLVGQGMLAVCDGQVQTGDVPVVGAGLMEELILRPRGEEFEVVGDFDFSLGDRCQLSPASPLPCHGLIISRIGIRPYKCPV